MGGGGLQAALAHIVDGGIRGGDPLAVHAGAVKCVKFRPMGRAILKGRASLFSR